MTASDIILLAANNLRRNIFRTILTVLGVAVGIGTLTSMISLGRGVSMNISSQMECNDLFTGLTVSSRDIDYDNFGTRQNLIVDSGEITPLTDSTIQEIRQMNEVSIVYPEVIKPATIKLAGKQTSTNLKAVPAEMSSFHPFDKIRLGSFYSADNEPCVVISKAALNQMGIILEGDNDNTIGQRDNIVLPADSIIGHELEIVTTVFDPDKIHLITSQSKQFPVKGESSFFKIKGIVETNSFSSGMFSGGIFVPPTTCEYIPCLDLKNVYDIINGTSGKYGKYNSLHVRVKEHSQLKKAKYQIEEKGFQVFSIGDKLDDIQKVFYMLDTILAAIGTIALLISIVGIVNTLIMAIFERRKEIGIMKSLGARQLQIKMIFYFEAAIIGFAGGIAGVIGGKVAAETASGIANSHLDTFIDSNIEYFSYSWDIVLLSILFAVVVSVAASIYPANKASKIDPLDALRRE